MSAQTFNPISKPFDHLPPRQPGTVIVSLHNGQANQISYVRVPIRSTLLELMTARVIGSFAILVVLLLAALGLVGFVLSLVLASGWALYLILNRKSPLSTFFIGPSPKFYLVDVSPHTVTDERRVQLADIGIYAKVEIEYRATVIDPIGVVERGISDVRDYLSRRFYTEIARLAVSGKLDDKIGGLRQNLSMYATQIPKDELISVEETTFEVAVEGPAAEQLARLSASSLHEQGIKVQHRINVLERSYYEMIISDDNVLRAEMMRPEVDKATLQAALRMRLDASEVSFNQKMTLMKIALEHGIVQEHHIRRDYPEFVGRIISSIDDVTGVPQNETRRIAAEATQTTSSKPSNNGADPPASER